MEKQMRNRLSEGFNLSAIAEEFRTTTDSVILTLLSDGLLPSQIDKQLGTAPGYLLQQSMQEFTTVECADLKSTRVWINLYATIECL